MRRRGLNPWTLASTQPLAKECSWDIFKYFPSHNEEERKSHCQPHPMLASSHRSPRGRARIVVSPTVPLSNGAQLPGWATSSAVSDTMALPFPGKFLAQKQGNVTLMALQQAHCVCPGQAVWHPELGTGIWIRVCHLTSYITSLNPFSFTKWKLQSKSIYLPYYCGSNLMACVKMLLKV